MIRVAGPSSPYDPTYHLLVRFDKIAAIAERERPEVLEIHSPYLAALGALRVPPAHFGVRTFQWHSDSFDTYAGVLATRVDATLEARLPEAGAARGARFVRASLGLAGRPMWSLYRAIAERCDATLVASACQRDKLLSHGFSRVVHVPFGIERETFRPDARSPEGRAELLALTGRAPSPPALAAGGPAVLVAVGRFAIEKRWDIVLDAFARVRARRDAVLVLFGDGPERERMKARVASSPDVAFAGFVKGRDALARALASADAMVHGCPFETFGLSIAEAMSCGLPAVVPDEGGAAEMHAEGAGERYRSGDADACAHAVERLLTRLERDQASLREATANATRHLPTVRDQFAKQIEIYRELLARRAATKMR